MILQALSMFLAAQAAPPTDAADYPLAAVLEAAKEACGRDALPSSNPATRHVKWQAFRPEPDSWFALFAAKQGEGGGGMAVMPRSYRASVAGRELVALVLELRFSFRAERAARL